VRHVGTLRPTITTTTAETQIPGAEVHFTATPGLRGKNRLHAGKDIYGRNFRRARAFRAEYNNGFTMGKIFKSYDRHVLKRLTKISHAATAHAAATTSASTRTTATSGSSASLAAETA